MRTVLTWPVVFLCLCSCSCRPVAPDRQDLPAGTGELIAVAAGARPFPARLSGFPYRRCELDGDLDTDDLESLGKCRTPELETLVNLRDFRREHLVAEASSSRDRLHLEGLWHLTAGRSPTSVGKAIDALRKATESDQAATWSDLAVAYSLDVCGGALRARLRALDAVERALELEPARPEARFNRALWLDGLAPGETVRHAWRQFLAVADGDDWRAEAASRLARLDSRAPIDEWPSIAESLRSFGEAELQARLETLDGYRQQVRMLGERQLSTAWAENELRGATSAAEQALEQAGAIGEWLAGPNGDEMLEASVQAIRGASSGDRRRAATGHLAHRRALDLYRRGEIKASADPFAEALAQLDAAATPFAAWTELHLAIVDYFRSDFEGAYGRLQVIARKAAGARHGSLEARCYWLMGLCRGLQGELTQGIALYHDSLSIYRRLDEKENATVVEFLLAESLQILGATDRAWEHRLRALRGLGDVLDPKRRHNILYDAAEALLQQGYPRVAIHFQDAMVRNAELVENPLMVAEAHIWRARTRSLLGRHRAALADASQAARAAERGTDPDRRRRTLADVALVRGTSLVAIDPAAALVELDRALDAYRLAKDEVRLHEIYLTRARAMTGLGDRQAAAASLRRGIEFFEQRRREIDPDELRISYFDRSRELFDSLIDLLATDGRPLAAAQVAERGRARALRDLLQPAVPTAGLEQLSRELPSGMVLVQYRVLSDRTLAWVVHRDGVSMFELDVDRSELEALADSLERNLRTAGEPAAGLEMLAELGRRLLAPLGETVTAAEGLIVVPDLALHRLPFAAMRVGGRFLFEGSAVAVAPSTAVFLDLRRRTERLWEAPPDRLLAVADPILSGDRVLDLEPLPATRREAAAIAALYPGDAQILVGEAATREQFLALLPRAEVLHFATHALPHPRLPLRSFLVLSPGTGDDGLLYAHELYESRSDLLRLAILAACRTARGIESSSEGPLSLARPFLARGVPVLATLWDVDDRASAELMTSFHRHLRAGHGPARALRRAQLEMLRKDGPASVSSFAAFEFIGPIF